MQNQENGVVANFNLDDVVKPSNTNALAHAIQYDYVISDDMLAADYIAAKGASTEFGLDVDRLLGGESGNKIAGENVTGDIHVLVNTTLLAADNAPALYFKTGTTAPHIHVHTICPFSAYVGTSDGNASAHYSFYTHGEAEAVTFTGIRVKWLRVGAFKLNMGIASLPANSTFIYENALNGVPMMSQGTTVTQASWMTNQRPNQFPDPDFGTNNHAYLRATDNPMAGEPDTVEWVQPFHVLGWDSGTAWEEVDLMTLKVQDTPQGDWGVQATGDGISMPGVRYLVPAAAANAFLKADANGKMQWAVMPSPTSEIVYVSTSDTYATVSGHVAAGKEVILKVDVSATLSQYFRLAQKNPDGSYEFTCMRPGGTAITGYSYILATNNNWTRSNIALAQYSGSDTITVDNTNRQISIKDASIGYGQLKRNVWRQLYGSASNEGWVDTYDMDRTITGASSTADRILGYVWDYTTKSQLFFTKNAGDDCASQLIHVDFNMTVQPGSSAYAANRTVFKIYLLAQNGGAANMHPISYQERRFEFAPGFSGKHNISGSFTIDTQLLSAFDLTNDPEVCLYFAPWSSQWDTNVGINITNVVISGFCLGHP